MPRVDNTQNNTSTQQTLETSVSSSSSMKSLSLAPTQNNFLTLVNVLPLKVSVNGMDFSLPRGILELQYSITLSSGQEDPVSRDLME